MHLCSRRITAATRKKNHANKQNAFFCSAHLASCLDISAQMSISVRISAHLALQFDISA